MADHRVHIDTLEYTRQGLRTRQGIPLQVGQHNRVVLVRPDRQPAIAASYAGFAPNLSFPGPAVLSALLHEHLASDGVRGFAERVAPGKQLQIFAHADTTGSEADNKSLTDRRAACMLAFLTRDVDEVLRIGDAEQWGPEFQQVMLRALERDPGPIDGVFENLTRAAVEGFQTAYGQRSYHREDEPLLLPELAVDGDLGPDTRDALVDAYVSKFSPRLSPDSFVATAPANGCAFHNPASVPDDATNRRVSLVVHGSPPSHPDAIPCTTGDPMACPAVQDAAKQACMWYREHVLESPFEQARHHHFLPSWGGDLLSGEGSPPERLPFARPAVDLVALSGMVCALLDDGSIACDGWRTRSADAAGRPRPPFEGKTPWVEAPLYRLIPRPGG